MYYSALNRVVLNNLPPLLCGGTVRGQSTRTTLAAQQEAADRETTMSWHRWALGALLVGLALVEPVSAQQRAVGIAVRGGGFNALTSLNEPSTADFKQVGYSVGATLDVDLHQYLALRGDFTFARNELRQNDLDTGSELSRFFYDGGLQLQYPTASGWEPYLSVGAGAVTLHPVGTSDSDQTKAAGTVGLGLNYAIPGSDVGIIVGGKGWLYELSDLNGQLASFERTQFEVTWSAGLSYRIPFGSSAALADR